jgi:hypothetical protein
MAGRHIRYDSTNKKLESSTTGDGTTFTDLELSKIKFPASQIASAGANDLDDYEEGAWTPTLTSSGGGTPVYIQQQGFYTKIGKRVIAVGRVGLSSKGTLAAGQLNIASLPFTIVNTTNNWGVVSIGYFANLVSNVVFLAGIAFPNTATFDFRTLLAAGISVVNLNVADIANTFDIIFRVDYEATA